MSSQVHLPSGFYQATLRFGGAAYPRGAAMVFGGLVPATGTPTPVSCGTSIKAAFTAATGPYNTAGPMSAAGTFVDILVKFGPLDIGASAITPVGAQMGAAAGDASSPQISLLVQKVTALGGHIGRGRMFAPGLPESAIGTAGLLVPAQLTNLQTCFTAALNKLTTDGFDMYLLHRYDPDLGETPRAPTLVTALIPQGQTATTRHRHRR